MFSRSCAWHLSSPLTAAHQGVCMAGALALSAASAACNDPSSESRLGVTLASSDPVIVQFGCGSECVEASLSLAIDYPQGAYNSADTIQLLQYRIDYEIAGSKLDLPYYAEPLSLVIKPDELRPLTLVAAGDAQREELADALGSTRASGTASVQLGGYDWDNRQVFVRADFEVQFRRGQGSVQASDDTASQ
ncbi:MAG TPA: hypothetical protein VFN67_06315 [Polyangiales bacterium]|nr:hypothetical protein [Polyangiales bacterium]